MKEPLEIKRTYSRRKVRIPVSALDGETVCVVMNVRNVAGRLQYPFVYKISVKEAQAYPYRRETERQDATPYDFVLIPIGAFKKVARREEFPILNSDKIGADSPKMADWRKYL
jgi:hypothetical protein